ncbi:MAG: single-stranded DNA-binding protein [Propionibacteriaceae bacterium]|nr:single-stranded DNA-binding protein [Propionibacteriaceae bacterium]
MDSSVTLTGYVGNAVETRLMRSGDTAAHFRVASTPRVQREGVWSDGQTTWLTVWCYRGLADNVAASVNKGDPIIVEGKLRTRVWIDDQQETQERLVLEATTIGHDLTRGTAVFERSSRRGADEETDPFLAEAA